MVKRKQQKKKIPKKKKQPIKKKQSDNVPSEGNEEATHSVVALALKDVKTTNTSTNVLKLVKFCWCWLKKHFSEFIVTMFGVWAAFWLAGWGGQAALDKTTQQRLQLAYMENLYNGTAAKEILDTYADANSLGINVNRPNSTAALAAFQDSNVLQFLPIHKVSLLRSYVNSISTLNQSLQVCQGLLETQNYRRTTQGKESRQNVHENAAAVFAMSFVLLEELKEYRDEQSPDWENIKRIENRIELVKGKALKSEVTLSKGLTGHRE